MALVQKEEDTGRTKREMKDDMKRLAEIRRVHSAASMTVRTALLIPAETPYDSLAGPWRMRR